MKRVDLSAVVTMHNEGIVAYKTMRSVFEALERVQDVGYTYEVILHIDNGDEKTKEFVSRYKDKQNVFIYENNFGDLGSSRNFAAQKANGKYVSFLDGDDLISDNWYLESIKLLEASKEDIVVCPEAVLTFGVGQANVLTIQKDSFDKVRDTIILLGENRWGSVVTAKKEVFAKVPYHVLGHGYCYEDYVFNIETTDKGIKHKIAKETILFYRRSDKSMLSVNNQNNSTIPYVELFNLKNIKNIVKLNKVKQKQDKKVSFKEKGYKVYKRIRGNDFLNFFITPLAKLTIKILNYESPYVLKKKIPDFVYDGWVKINHIDSQLYPFKSAVDNVSLYSAESQSSIGMCYCEIVNQVRKIPDYIFIVPWIVRGGADKVLLNYLKAIKEIHPDWNLMVISTLKAKNTWSVDLPDNVDYIDFGKYMADFPEPFINTLFTRLIVQMKCKNIHIINSEFGYEWARKHKELLGAEYNLTTSLFAYEYIPGSKMQAIYSYDNPCLFEIYDVVKKVFTDNQKVIDYTVEENGFDIDRFKVHYQPVDDKIIKPKEKVCNEGQLNILWAGRVVPVKLPEIVAKIGKKINQNITIYVYGEIGEEVRNDIFENIPTIRYCGAYDGFNTLPIDKMDVFLYTSLTDGMPNTILEAAAAGLPIIASNDGGVSEFVHNDDTGILINDKLDVNEYVKAIEWASQNIQQMLEYAKNAQKLLMKQHSWKNFVEKVRKDFEL